MVRRAAGGGGPPPDDQALEGEDLVLQAGEIPIGGGGLEPYHRVHDALVQPGVVPARVPPLEGVDELFPLQLQGPQLPLALQGRLVPIEIGDRSPRVHLFPLVGDHIHDGRRLPGENDLLLPHQEPGGLHGVVHRVGVGGHGVLALVKALPGGHRKISAHRGKEQQHDGAGENGALLHT